MQPSTIDATKRRGTMAKLTFAAAALIAFSALAASAQGGPVSQNGQCFKYSVGNDTDARFGSWNACAQTDSYRTLCAGLGESVLTINWRSDCASRQKKCISA